jgi:hypothetical protein
MLNYIFFFIAKNYSIIFSIFITFIVVSRVLIHIFLNVLKEWAQTTKGIVSVVFKIAAVTYFFSILTFFLSGFFFGKNNALFIMVYYLIILNAITIYIIRKSDEAAPFQFLIVGLNIFHLIFTLIMISPPQIFNSLESSQRGCIIDYHCSTVDCPSNNNKGNTDNLIKVRCINFKCNCLEQD